MPDSQIPTPNPLQELALLRRRVAELEQQCAAAGVRIGEGDGPSGGMTASPALSHEHLRLLAANAPGVIYLCRNDSRYHMLYITESVYQLTGYTAADFMADRISFVDLFHPDDVRGVTVGVSEAIRLRQPFNLRYRLKHRDGRWLWANETGVAIFEGDRVDFLEGFISDVTEYERAQRELRQAHERLNLYFDHLPVAVVEWDERWRVIRWSGRAEEIFGWPVSEVMGKAWDDWAFVHPDDLPRVREFTSKLLAGETNAVIVRNRNYTRSNQIVHCEWITTVLRDETGAPSSMLSFVQDVTERFLADEALRASEKRYREIIDTAYEGVWVIDAKGQTTQANGRMARMLLAAPEQMIGANLLAYIHEADRPAAEAWLRQRESGVSEQREFRLRRSDGGEVWTIFSSTSTFDAQSRFAGVVNMVTDITDRVRAEGQVRALNAELEQRVQTRTAELEEVNKRLEVEVAEREQIARSLREQSDILELMLDNTAEGVIVANSEGRFLIWNKAATQIIGLGAQNLPIERWPDAYRCYMPDGKTMYRPEDLPLARAIAGEPVDEAELLVRRDGDLAAHTLSINARPLVNEHGQVMGGVIVFRDMTDHKQTENALKLVQAAIDQVGDSVVITDATIDLPGPRILYVNPAFTRLTGYTKDEAIGQTPRMLQGPATDRPVLDRVREALKAGEPFHGHTTNYRKDGKPFHLEWHIAPVRDAFGAITHWVSIQRDITELRRQEQLQREHQAELAHVARLSTMGEMASGLAHELNQPLAAISNYISGCLRRFDRGQVDEAQLLDALRRAGQQSERAGQIIQRLREFVKKGDPKRRATDINHTVREAVGLMEHDAREAGVAIRLKLAGDLPQVEADQIQIEQIILNLLRNAIEATQANAQAGPDSAVTIVTLHEPTHHRVHVQVVDGGIGVTPDQLNHIFDPFFTTKASGMGMGLNISQSLAEAHQGRLWATRNPECGMTFHLRLPGIEARE